MTDWLRVETNYPDLIATITGTEETQTHYLECQVGPYYFSIEPRPAYCDRGNWIAKITGPDIDGSDGWPRYYFDLDVAKQEIDAWLAKRGVTDG